MNAMRRMLRPTTWVALVAIWALALLPTVSHALAYARGDARAWVEVCTVQGVQRVALDAAADASDASDASGAPAPAQGAGLLDHCPYCHLGADRLAPPPAAFAGVVPPAGSDAPALFQQAPRTPFAWAGAQPRAPPRHS